jgi:UDP-3-O-[3-hydroxymyristoyl] glucosamine N-acyltransferase
VAEVSSRTLYVKSSGNRIHETSKIYGTSVIGKNCIIMENVILGYPSNHILSEIQSGDVMLERYLSVGTSIGDNAVVRSNSTYYCDVTIGNGLRTGHNMMVREMTNVGTNVSIGTDTVLDGHTSIGNNVSIQSNVYLPTNTVVENNAFNRIAREDSRAARKIEELQ